MTESPVCVVCHKRQETYAACAGCERRIETNLKELHDLWVDAHSELLPGRGGSGSSSNERTIGISVPALDWIAGHDLLGVLHSWERVVREERGLTPPALVPPAECGPGDDRIGQEVKATITFHLTHLPWVCEQGTWVDEFAIEVRRLHSQGEAAARRFREKVRRIPCPADNANGLPCGASLTLPDDLSTTVVCPRCRSDWSPVQLMRVALSTPDLTVWLDGEAIATFLGITEGQVRRLVRDHHLTRRKTVDGDYLYDINAVRDARGRDREDAA
jgi:hypothetical protein